MKYLSNRANIAPAILSIKSKTREKVWVHTEK